MRNWGSMLESLRKIEKTTMKKSCEQFCDFFTVLGGYTLAIVYIFDLADETSCIIGT